MGEGARWRFGDVERDGRGDGVRGGNCRAKFVLGGLPARAFCGYHLPAKWRPNDPYVLPVLRCNVGVGRWDRRPAGPTADPTGRIGIHESIPTAQGGT